MQFYKIGNSSCKESGLKKHTSIVLIQITYLFHYIEERCEYFIILRNNKTFNKIHLLHSFFLKEKSRDPIYSSYISRRVLYLKILMIFPHCSLRAVCE